VVEKVISIDIPATPSLFSFSRLLVAVSGQLSGGCQSASSLSDVFPLEHAFVAFSHLMAQAEEGESNNPSVPVQPESLRVVSSQRCSKAYQTRAASGSLDVTDCLAVLAQFEKD